MLNAAALGLSVDETAVTLRIKAETVRSYRRMLKTKLGARNMPRAVALGIYAGVVRQDFELPRRSGVGRRSSAHNSHLVGG